MRTKGNVLIGITAVFSILILMLLPMFRAAYAQPDPATAVPVVDEIWLKDCSAWIASALVNDPDVRHQVSKADAHYPKKFAHPEGMAQLDLARTAVAYCTAVEEALEESLAGGGVP